MSDIIDRIDELVDASLAVGPVDDYTMDRGQLMCPHREVGPHHWHGLPISVEVLAMYRDGRYRESYEVSGDDSPIACRGSDFIGPMGSINAERRDANMRLLETIDDFYEDTPLAGGRFAAENRWPTLPPYREQFAPTPVLTVWADMNDGVRVSVTTSCWTITRMDLDDIIAAGREPVFKVELTLEPTRTIHARADIDGEPDDQGAHLVVQSDETTAWEVAAGIREVELTTCHDPYPQVRMTLTMDLPVHAARLLVGLALSVDAVASVVAAAVEVAPLAPALPSG